MIGLDVRPLLGHHGMIVVIGGLIEDTFCFVLQVLFRRCIGWLGSRIARGFQCFDGCFEVGHLFLELLLFLRLGLVWVLVEMDHFAESRSH